MALTECKECGHSISDKADQCPNCGAPVKRKGWGCGISVILMILISIAVLYYLGEQTVNKVEKARQEVEESKKAENKTYSSSQSDIPFKLVDLVNKKPSEIERILGSLNKLENGSLTGKARTFQVKRGEYKDGLVEVTFIDNGARYITIYLEKCTNWKKLSENMSRCTDTKSYYGEYLYPRGASKVLKELGLEEVGNPDFSNDFVTRWKNLQGIYEISVFPIEENISYVLVLTDGKYE